MSSANAESVPTIKQDSLPKGKLFLFMWGVGLLGVFTLLLIPLNLPPNTELPFSRDVLKLLSVVQSAILLAIAVSVGVLAAPRVGLTAPFAEALVTGKNGWPKLWPQVVPGIIGGVVLGLCVVIVASLAQPYLPDEFTTAGAQAEIPILTRFLYGGITEELLLRWGFMSFLVWLLWRLGQRGVGSPKTEFVWVALFVAALVFGLGHLPAVYVLVAEPTTLLMGYIVGLNMLVGLVFGWLYWRQGLESAVIGHILFHVTVLIITAIFGGS